MIKYNVINPIAELHEVPDEKALRGKLESQLVYGEEFIAEKEQNGWLFGTCTHDGYAGWSIKKICPQLQARRRISYSRSAAMFMQMRR